MITGQLIKETQLRHADIVIDETSPRFRRATTNMIATTQLCEDILKLLPENFNKDHLGVIYATEFGEITSSADYLLHLKRDKISKPILFQNSLHNSTLGFTSIELKLTGPCLTVSAGKKMNEGILHTMNALFVICEYVLVCKSDSVPESHAAYYNHSFADIVEKFNQTTVQLYKRVL
jgi:hypothetical protein